MELRSYQRHGVEWLKTHRTGLLADDMGLGKSAQLITAAMEVGAQRIVIVCPAVVVPHWMRELDKWSGGKIFSFRIRGRGRRSYDILDSDAPMALVLNYDILKAQLKSLVDYAPDTLIFDESHYLKNRDAQRSKAAKSLSNVVRAGGGRVWLASGTPMPSRPIELVNQLDLMGRLKSWRSFVVRYCEGHQEWVPIGGGKVRKVWMVDGASNLDELHERLRAGPMLRRLRSEALPDITVMPATLQMVDISDTDMNQYYIAESDIRAYIDLRPDAKGEHLAKLSVLRRLLGEAKVDSVYNWIMEWHEGNPDGQLVVFAHHRDSLYRLYERLMRTSILVGLITGEVSITARDFAITQFRSAGAVGKILLCSTQAAGIGIDLTPCSDVMFYELEWVSSAHRQAIDRCARHGAVRPISVTFLVAPDTVDEQMAGYVIETLENVDAVMDSDDVAMHTLKGLTNG
jgi:SNF2 family DNA or RNA helicase